MRKSQILISALIISVLQSCQNTGSNDHDNAKLPRPGTVVASIGMHIPDDTLNHFSCSVKVIADSAVSDGVYDLDASYGPNMAEGKFVLPKGGPVLLPCVKTGATPCTFIVGFNMPGDTTFYDYYEVICNGTSTRMQYIKSYSF